MSVETCQEPAPDCTFPTGCTGFNGRVPCCCITKQVGHTGLHRYNHHEWEDKKMCCNVELGTKENPHPAQPTPEFYVWYCRNARCGKSNLVWHQDVEGRKVACLTCATWHKMVL